MHAQWGCAVHGCSYGFALGNLSAALLPADSLSGSAAETKAGCVEPTARQLTLPTNAISVSRLWVRAVTNATGTSLESAAAAYVIAAAPYSSFGPGRLARQFCSSAPVPADAGHLSCVTRATHSLQRHPHTRVPCVSQLRIAGQFFVVFNRAHAAVVVFAYIDCVWFVDTLANIYYCSLS